MYMNKSNEEIARDELLKQRGYKMDTVQNNDEIVVKVLECNIKVSKQFKDGATINDALRENSRTFTYSATCYLKYNALDGFENNPAICYQLLNYFYSVLEKDVDDAVAFADFFYALKATSSQDNGGLSLGPNMTFRTNTKIYDYIIKIEMK